MIGVKDNMDVAGVPTTDGSLVFRNHVPKKDMTLWKLLKENGGIMAGKMKLNELAYAVSGANVVQGNVLNPYDLRRSSGGSSSGSGSAVGAGVLSFALATDTSGSIRIPAAWNGCVGYRPTVNRWPCDFGSKGSHVRDTIGPIVNCVADVAYLDEIITW